MTDLTEADLERMEAARSCTCHPDDNPPSPCPRKYALTDCFRAELERVTAERGEIEAWLDEQGVPQEGDLAAEPTPVTLLGRVQWLAEERDEARAKLQRREAVSKAAWGDQADEWTDAISAAHPMRSTRPGCHDTFQTAMDMVGHRHGKYELVGLANWLLAERDEARAELARVREEIKEASSGATMACAFHKNDEHPEKAYSDFRVHFFEDNHAERAKHLLRIMRGIAPAALTPEHPHDR